MTCLNTFACTSCSVNYIYSVDINSCISCPAGRFSAGRTSTLCTTCFAGCSTCTSSANNTCTGCLPQFYLVNSTCTACNNGSYSLGGIESTCTACSVGCTVCTSDIICSSCSATYGLNSLNNCILCLPGTYSLGGSTACLSCNAGCSSCTSSLANSCQSCIINYILSNNSCSFCPFGSFSAGGIASTCRNCSAGCTRCTSFAVCT